MTLSRRDMIISATAAGVSAVAARTALAKAPLATAQVTPIQRMKVGDFQVTAIADGYLDLDVKLFPLAAKSPQATAQLLTAARTANPVRTFVNTYLVNTGDKLVLIDTGTANAMGPSLGHLARNLTAAGINPGDIDAVLLTHMHPDHVNGLTVDGKAAFANAEVVVADQEYKFWHDDGIASRAPDDAKPFFKIARDAIKPYEARTRRFNGATEVIPGIRAEAAPGHTVGHTMYRIASGKDQLVVWGDIVHIQALQFPRPDASLAFDTDQAQAAASRRKVFDMAAKDGVKVAGMHLSFPGVGYVERSRNGYAFQPTAWSPTV